jgi:O-antigen ligase
VPLRDADKDVATPSDLAGEKFSSKRGHSVTFVGVFLFTFLVYFRPYELTTRLLWLSSAAFVVALLTLVVYLPVQLGLEGRITSRPREVKLVLLLTVMALLSVPFALDRFLAWKSFIDFLKVVTMFIVMINVVRTRQRLRLLLLLVLAASCVVSLAALNDYRTGNLTLQGVRIEGVIGGLLENPNDLALHLVTMFPIAIGLVGASRSIIKKLIYLGCGLLIVAGTVATFSRGGFLALVCVVGYIFWSVAKSNRALVLGIGLVLGVAVLALAPGDYRSRIFESKDASASARKDDLKRSIFLMARHPVLGVGIGNYVLYSNLSKATHNAYTQVGAELGLIALAFYLLFLFGPTRQLKRLRTHDVIRADRKLRWLTMGLEASLVGYMVASFFASVAFLWYAYYLVAFAVCWRRMILIEIEAGNTGHPSAEKKVTLVSSRGSLSHA